jgi:hypothetical protein
MVEADEAEERQQTIARTGRRREKDDGIGRMHRLNVALHAGSHFRHPGDGS